MPKGGFKWDAGRIRSNARDFPDKVRTRIGAHVDYWATAGEVDMKVNASWTDRTGAARAGLHAVSARLPNGWEITFAHSVSYGIWLEVAHGGQYRIILPAMLRAGDQLMASLENVFGEVR